MRRRLIPLGLAAGAYALAFAQRPGELVADTKIDLHVDPVGFLADAAAAWAPSGGLGQVQAGQYAGYLWPMGPFHALADLAGIAPWVAHRLWLGTLLALAAWGTVRLLDALLARERGAAHVVAGALMVANPYVVTFANRTSVTLLAYALLPWLLLAVHRGLREPRGWRWPAALALLVTSLGGGVNAAVAAWVLIGPAALIAYELAVGDAPRRAASAFLARAAPLTVAASAWWLVPVAIQVTHGVDFLAFTEPAGAIWTSTSMSESLRLMGYWVGYLGVGYGPTLAPSFDSAPTMLYSAPVVVASFAVPGLAIAGFAWTRRWRYGPFFAALALLALAIMFTGFPDGAPLRRALGYAYHRVELVQFLRTTYKAGPLLALAVACLGGAAAGALWARLRGRAALAAGATLAAVALVVGSAWPLFAGRAVDAQVSFDDVPGDWRRAAADVERNLPPATRALVMPGQVFPFYRWGGTQDPILPALTDRPVAVRGVVPYADLRAVDMLWSTDALVQQRRALPGQLTAPIRLMGAGHVVVGADDDLDRSGAVDPAAAAAQLRRGAGLGEPDRRFGAVRRYGIADPQRLVRVKPLAAPLVVDGSAPGLLGFAAVGGPDAFGHDRAIHYAADLSPDEIRRAARSGAEIAITDSNRRRVLLPSQPRQAEGATLAAGDPVPRDAAMLDPFGVGSHAQTVATYDGAESIQAPFSALFVQFPEHRPYAAFDGDPSTWWRADRHLEEEDRWIEIDFGRPVDAPYVELLPRRDTATEVRAVEVGGRRFAVDAGWNRLPVRLRGAERLRIEIAELDGPPPGFARGAGAIAEVRVPGVRVRERLRPPLIATRALQGTDLRRASLSFVLERTLGNDPFGRRADRERPTSVRVAAGANDSDALVDAAGDGERIISRRLLLPASRRWRADGWVSAAPSAGRAALARAIGVPAGAPRCGAVVARVGGEVLPMRVRASAARLAAGRPARALPCGPPVALPVGEVALTASSEPLRVDLLRLRSSAPAGAAAPAPAGRVVDPGDDGRSGRDGVRVSLREPAWLVLGESHNRGWRASCDGRDLGEPRPIDGFANGWRAPRDCRDVEIAFAPQSTANAGYAISAVAAVLLFGLLAASALRRRRRRSTAGERATAGGERRMAPVAGGGGERRDGPLRMPLRAALAIGAAAGVLGGFVFALRAGVVIGPAVALLLWRGAGAATLALAAGALTAIALPAIYLAFPAADRGGFNSEYAQDLVGAHWVAVAVWVLLALAVSRAIPRRRAGAPPGAGAG